MQGEKRRRERKKNIEVCMSSGNDSVLTTLFSRGYYEMVSEDSDPAASGANLSKGHCLKTKKTNRHAWVTVYVYLGYTMVK